MLLFLDHILYRRAHFVHDVLCTLRAVLAIRGGGGGGGGGAERGEGGRLGV